MPVVSGTRIVPFAAARMYEAVIDIESYPRILQFIRGVEILERTDGIIRARVHVGLPVLKFSYDCLIRTHEPERIDIDLISGPFENLQASWGFEPAGPESCNVHYRLDSRFKNPLVEKTAGALFAAQLAHSIKAFEAALRRS